MNPNKCLFSISEGKISEHIVNKEGIYIDLERVKVFIDFSPPTSKKGVQSFFWQEKNCMENCPILCHNCEVDKYLVEKRTKI